MYQEIKPSEELSTSIDSFWTFSNNQILDQFKVLPDTCTDLIFDLRQNIGYISGAMTKYQLMELNAHSDLIGIRFKVEHFGNLSTVPLNEVKNLRVDFSQMLPSYNTNIFNRLSNLETTTKKIDFLEKFIITISRQNHHKQDKLVLSVARRIRQLKGILSIEGLAKDHYISLRQLQRRFKKYMGLTIKEFANIVRFNNAKKDIKTYKDLSLMEVAYNMGFHDHSHMHYEFNRISGENPSHFR